MKKINSLLMLLLLSGCVQIHSKEPLIGSQTIQEKISLLNAYPNEINTFLLGATVFQNKSIKRSSEEFNLSNYIKEKTTSVFNQINNINVLTFDLKPSEKTTITYKDGESLANYEKKIQKIPTILEKARSLDIDKVIIITPSRVMIPDAPVSVFGTGYWYSSTGAVFPYSSMNFYVIDSRTNEIVGLHDLGFMGTLLKLENDLPTDEINKITEEYNKEKNKLEQAHGAGTLVSLNNRLGAACGDINRYESYGTDNKSIIKNASIESIDQVFLKLEKIYLDKELNKKNLKDYFQGSGRNMRYAQSCEI